MKKCICKIYKDDNVHSFQILVLLMYKIIFLSINLNNNGIIKVSIDEDKTFLNINLE